MKKLSKLEWYILDDLAVDMECPATICRGIETELPETNRKIILETLYNLFQRKLIFIKNRDTS